MPVRLSSNNYSAADCARPSTRRRRRRASSRCRSMAGPRPTGRPAWTWPASLSAGRDVRLSDRQTVRVIYVHSILSVLLARRVPGRLLALIKKSAHEMVDPVLHISVLPRRDSILSPFSSLTRSSVSIHLDSSSDRLSVCISYHELYTA